MKRLLRLGSYVIFAVVFCPCIGSGLAATEEPAASVLVEKTPGGSLYTWALGNCRISLEIGAPATVSAGIMSVHRSELCKQPYESQLQVIGELLDLVVAKPGEVRELTTLFWGGPRLPEERERLLNAFLLLEQVPPPCDDDNCRVLEALNRSGAFDDLQGVFESRGLRLHLKSVEGVHRVKGRDLSRLGIDSRNLVKPIQVESAVPVTAVVWFAIQDMSSRSPCSPKD